MAEENKGICRRIVNEVINKGNLSLVDTLVAPNYVCHGPGGQEVRGREGFKQLLHVYRTAFPDMNMTIEDLIAEDDKVVVRWTARGTHKGDLTGIAPTGKMATARGIIVSRFVRGQVAEDWESHDEVSMLRHLGLHTTPTPTHA